MSGAMLGNSGFGGGGSAGSFSSAGKFKRYSMMDLFDEQYGHLKRNELLEALKQEKEKQMGLSISTSASKNSVGAFMNIFIVGE